MVENTTIEVRQQNLDATDSMAQYESPDSEDVCASYVSRDISEQLGEFATLSIRDDASVEAHLQKETTNYAVYETAGGHVTGLYISRDLFGDESPESIGLSFAPSDEESFNEAQEEREEESEEEIEGLLSDSDDSDDDPDGSTEIVADEITDDELGLPGEEEIEA
jgi:hypothetical protein